MSGLTVSQLARAAGVGSETVRHYEEIGLLPKAQRSASGYRHFSADAMQRIGFILRAKSLGFGLPEIAELLRLSDQRHSSQPDDMATLRAAAAHKIAEVEARIVELQRIRSGLEALVKSCPGSGPIRECPILAALAGSPTTGGSGKKSDCCD